MTIRTYSELSKLETIEERYRYLKLEGVVGKKTWGWDRYFNQRFYRSRLWKSVRDAVILRDNGCDLGVDGFAVGSRLLIHHMNPIWIDDLKTGNPDIINPEYLITTSEQTHQAIHYGDLTMLPKNPVVRIPGDTKLW